VSEMIARKRFEVDQFVEVLIVLVASNRDTKRRNQNSESTAGTGNGKCEMRLTNVGHI
jgi:hypothetical protein